MSIRCCLTSALGVCLLCVLTRLSLADDPPAKDAPKKVAPAAESADEETPVVTPVKADPFKVPDDNDEQALKLFLGRLQRQRPVQSPEGVKDYLVKMHGAATELMTRDTTPEILMNAVGIRMQCVALMAQFGVDHDAEAEFKAIDGQLVTLSGPEIEEKFVAQALATRAQLFQARVQSGVEGAVEKQAEFLKSLQEDERPFVGKLARKMSVGGRLNQLPEMKADERTKFIADVAGLLEGEELDNESVQMALMSVRYMEMTGSYDDARSAVNMYLKYLGPHATTQLGEAATKQLQASLAKLEMIGKPFELTGKTLSGEDFNITSYKGKVVLVDFWATWCGPCLNELPNVKEQYKLYHAKGFEVVGISLDDDQVALEEFLDEEKISWVNLFPEEENQRGWANPLAEKFGVSGIPATFVVDQKGNLHSISARGPMLKEILEELLGPVEAPASEEEPAENAGPKPGKLNINRKK